MQDHSHGTPWILSCEAMKTGVDVQERYELRVAVLLDSHQQLDEKISTLLKDSGYLFLYSDEIKSVIQYLEEAEFYDQVAIELSQQVSKQQPIVFQEIKLISSESLLPDTEFLTLTDVDTPPLPEQEDEYLAFWEKPWISDELKSLLFAQPSHLQPDTFLRTYLILDATLYTNIRGVFDLDLITSLPVQCLYKGRSAQELEKVAPYIVDMTLPNIEYDSLREEIMDTPSFHKDFFEKYWGNGTGIFIRSTANMEDISQHLRKFTKVQHPEGNRVFFLFYLPHIAIQYFNIIKLRLDPCKSWMQPKADKLNLQILCEQNDGKSIHVIEASDSLKKNPTAQIAFALTKADLECFEKTQIEKDTIKLSELLQQDFVKELADLSFDNLNKMVTEAVVRMQSYGFKLKESLYLLAAWEMFFGDHFETQDTSNQLLEICQSNAPEAQKIKLLSTRMNQLSAGDSTS